MSTQHTPGPWALCGIGDYGDFDRESQVILSEYRRLAAVHVSDEETKANALLIAAAPELLNVCLAIDAHYSGSLDHQPAYVRMARAAIAKAAPLPTQTKETV